MTLEHTDSTVLAWHFVNNDGTLNHDLSHVKVTPGLFLTVDADKLELCEHGLHASIRAIDALEYASGNIVCRVRMGGTILYAEDKLVASERTVLWTANATHALQTFAIDCAERALQIVRDAGFETDADSWAALEVARRYLAGSTTLTELSAYAAYAVTHAAEAAADAAAYAVTHVNSSNPRADYAAAREWQEQHLTALLLALEP